MCIFAIKHTMLPAYNLTIDITASSATIDGEQFATLLAPCQAHLSALQGAFSRKPCTLTYYPPDVQLGSSARWSARGAVMISLGKDRAEFLLQLYESIAQLITLQLPDCEVEVQISKFQFS